VQDTREHVALERSQHLRVESSFSFGTVLLRASLSDCNLAAASQVGSLARHLGYDEAVVAVVRSATGNYLLAFLISGLACLLAALLVLQITRPLSINVPAH
jgi:hypothetical protein